MYTYVQIYICELVLLETLFGNSSGSLDTVVVAVWSVLVYAILTILSP